LIVISFGAFIDNLLYIIYGIYPGKNYIWITYFTYNYM